MLPHAFVSTCACASLLMPLVHGAAINSTYGNSTCKVIPNDPKWPDQDTWNRLNQTLDGRLIASVPEAAVCHPGGYGPLKEDKTACDTLQQLWSLPEVYLNSTSDTMSSFFQGNWCNAYYNLDKPCHLGGYVSYAISVSDAEDAAAGLRFAKDHNVRLVIRNTGHDFTGKSTGKGGLQLWTHNLKSSQIITSYRGDSNYTGPALQLGAGWTGGEVELLVHAAGYRVVSGDCPTVGIAGGYTQGGGHSLLNSVYGMAADNVLEFEVVTADGKHLIATPIQNEDLYWALAGGGGGTYALVLSMTIKIYKDDGPIGAATLAFNATGPDDQAYSAAIAAWWEFLPTIIDSDSTCLFIINGSNFELQNVTATGRDGDWVADLLQPYRSQLESLNIHFDFASYTPQTYYEHYNAVNGPLPLGVYPTSELFNSRLIPRAVTQDQSRAKSLTDAMLKGIASDPEAGFFFGCSAQNVKDSPQHPDNAVVSYWRDGVAICITIAIYDWSLPEAQMMRRRQHMADVITPMIEAETQDSGAYLNEADPLVYPPDNPAHWQKAFYGDNYPKLKQIKQKYDPDSIFYGNTAVGSEEWRHDKDGRLCKA